MRALLRCFSTLLATLTAWPTLVQSETTPMPALASALRQEIQAAWPQSGDPLQGRIHFVVGNQLWQPGRQFAKGSDWLALACTAEGCRLEPAQLEVKHESWQGHYDDQPTQGQKLAFKKTTPSAGRAVAWFRTTHAPAWLRAGSVPTYHSSAQRLKPPPGSGTLETLVELPDGQTATLVPMLLREKAESWNLPSFLLQLRSGDKRQFLPGELGTCSKVVDARYLLWAGDLDGDRRPDYLVSFVDADGQVHLYLSSRATAKQLVGLAGDYDAPPNGGECDGGGWFN